AGRAKALPAFRDRHLTGSPPGHPAAPRSCDRLPPAHVWGLSRMSRSAGVFAAVLTLVFGLVPLPAAQAAEAPELSPPQAASAFSDVPADHLFYEAVSWLADQGITRGCNPPRNDCF